MIVSTIEDLLSAHKVFLIQSFLVLLGMCYMMRVKSSIPPCGPPSPRVKEMYGTLPFGAVVGEPHAVFYG